MALDSATNNIYHDIKMSLKVFSHNGAVALASIYRGTCIYRGTDRSGTCSKCHKTKKCHQKNSFVALSNVTKLRKCCSDYEIFVCYIDWSVTFGKKYTKKFFQNITLLRFEKVH